MQLQIPTIILATMLAAGTATQATPRPQPGVQLIAARRQAPVGHRQPKLSDLPPRVAQRERSGDPAEPPDQAQAVAQRQRTIDQDLRICRGC